MYNTDTSWTEDSVTVIIGADAPIIIRMSNDEASELYGVLRLRAQNHSLYNQPGTFDVGNRSYDLTAGQWASVYRGLGDWDYERFDHVGDMFADVRPFTLHAVN